MSANCNHRGCMLNLRMYDWRVRLREAAVLCTQVFVPTREKPHPQPCGGKNPLFRASSPASSIVVRCRDYVRRLDLCNDAACGDVLVRTLYGVQQLVLRHTHSESERAKRRVVTTCVCSTEQADGDGGNVVGSLTISSILTAPRSNTLRLTLWVHARGYRSAIRLMCSAKIVSDFNRGRCCICSRFDETAETQATSRKSSHEGTKQLAVPRPLGVEAAAEYPVRGLVSGALISSIPDLPVC